MKCDFCSAVPVVDIIPAKDNPLAIVGNTLQVSRGAWAACADCLRDVRAGNREAIALRAAKRLAPARGLAPSDVVEHLREWQQAFWDAYDPATTGQADPAPSFAIHGALVSELAADLLARGQYDDGYVLPFARFNVRVVNAIIHPKSGIRMFVSDVKVAADDRQCLIIGKAWNEKVTLPVETTVPLPVKDERILPRFTELHRTVKLRDKTRTVEDALPAEVLLAVLHILDHRDVSIVEDVPANRQQRRATERERSGRRYEIRLAPNMPVRKVLSDLSKGRNKRHVKPHDRRAHLRRHPTSKEKTVRVRSSRINGGLTEECPYPIYRLVGESLVEVDKKQQGVA
jgi:hypothetical protein